MRQHDGPAAAGHDIAQGWHQPRDPGGIADLAVAQRHIQICPHQNPLVGKIYVVKRLPAHGPLRAPNLLRAIYARPARHGQPSH